MAEDVLGAGEVSCLVKGDQPPLEMHYELEKHGHFPYFCEHLHQADAAPSTLGMCWAFS